jgi:hypothetical protein
LKLSHVKWEHGVGIRAMQLITGPEWAVGRCIAMTLNAGEAIVNRASISQQKSEYSGRYRSADYPIFINGDYRRRPADCECDLRGH